MPTNIQKLRPLPTVRVKNADVKEGYVLINAQDFDHDRHELFDKKDRNLIPPAPNSEAADVEGLRKALSAAHDQIDELQSELAELKAVEAKGKK